MNLVIVSTGVLGSEICRLLTRKGKRVRGLVRQSSGEEKKKALQSMGVELVEGDLKDPVSLENACKNVENIISTATSVVTAREGDSFTTTDRDGNINLINAAEKAGVRRFIFISFPPIPLEFPLQSAKRAVEERLQKSKLTYTILQPTMFQEVWLGAHLGFDPANGTARVFGSGKNKVSWISFRDVAQFAALSLETPATENKVLLLGGPESMSPLEVIGVFEKTMGKKFKVEHVPEDALKAQYDAAPDPVQKSFSALMLYYASGAEIDMSSVLRMMPVQLQSIHDYAAQF
jgi:NADH dehydrogenase